MPTIEKAKKMRCPYMAAFNLCKIGWNWDSSSLKCDADQCPKWRFNDEESICAYNKETCPYDRACDECTQRIGYCG